MAKLTELSKGDDVKVLKIEGSDEIRKRMLEQGIRPGISLSIFSARPGAASIVIVNGSRIMIDRDTSEKVFVETL